MQKRNWFFRLIKPLLNERGEIGEQPEVNLTIDAGLPEKKEAVDSSVTDVDDILESKEKGKEPPVKKEEEKKEPLPGKEKEKPAEDDRFKTMETRLTRLEQDKKNLRIALHKERQGKKAETKEDVTLSDEQLKNILKENPDDPDIQLKVTRYMAEKIAKGMKDTALSEVDVSQKSKAINKLLLDRYPALADEGSEMRTEIDEVKESLGIKEHPFGDAFAVGVRVVENLPTLLTNAYNKGKEAALGTVAEKKRGEKIDESKLSPKGSGKSSVVTELTADQDGTAKQLNMTASQKKIYAKLVGKQPRTLSVEE
jgi:hypothetical protein